ncbi:MAG: hypothetical protein ACI9TH_000258 [Kiritimatiellia bacterium]|jgi:hypothetical protein
MSRKGEDDFYVGYMKTAPAALGAVMRKWVVLMIIITAIVATAISLSQKPFRTGVFEFGTVDAYLGIVRLDPVPVAMANKRWADVSFDEKPYYLLVNQGKFGAAALFEGMDGACVSFDATRIYRDGQQMLEVVPGSVVKDGASFTDDALTRVIGQHTFRGEIVDSKCYLGVMNPGNLKTHKACAIRCISGGVPPVLVVRDIDDDVRYLILIGPNGEAMNEHVLDKIAEPVEISGTVEERGGFFYLRAGPDAIKRM